MKNDSIKKIFDSLDSFKAIERLIDEGESENDYLECKAPTTPVLDKGLKAKLSQAISGFSNNAGGIIIWGVSTTPHNREGLDVLTQIQEIGSIKQFKKQIDLSIPNLSKPSLDSCLSKVITRESTDTRGLAITYIPKVDGDPIQANDGKFWLRVRAEFVEMPYETLKRMFCGTAGPDLEPLIDNQLVKLNTDGSWNIPIVIQNRSSAAARDTEVSVVIQNPDVCEKISTTGFKDQSDVNPGEKIFMIELNKPLHRGLNSVVGNLVVKMKKAKLSKRRLDLEINIYSSNMRAKTTSITIQLAKKGFSITKVKSNDIY